ncbi:MAG: helix-hairpin-helix domain-containing protein [Candidatus Dadabacteria bacterium]|nr:helix-hairpin-helix domain-containing protein [Candidatus Dadabacteria bacterium]NIS08339.1 helix-hairpin-helix domain-containing protein [Candidatus Dadabacteria bacterium]NIV43117.1 hypothetical protein [Candidatus Dadabacteria bacterium]NIX14731.1 hypothetical protein [Candidatus Dadabacteria bacterium]NIY22248.1 hypothetical protein [Candidatus Dadabacteria bacterium]
MSGHNIIIQIEQDNIFPVVYQFNNDTISKTTLPFPLRISEIINGRKYYIDTNHNIYNTSEISGKHKIALGMPININNATLADLTAILGIVNVTGQNIIDYREAFGKFNDLNH